MSSHRQALNPMTQWMNWDEVYATFDSIEILRKQDDGKMQSLGTITGEKLSWPLAATLIGSLMQYSAMETGFSQPLTRQEDFLQLAEHLKAQDENSFVLRCKGFKTGSKTPDTYMETGKAMNNLMFESAKFWMPYLSGPLEAQRKAANEMADKYMDSMRPQLPDGDYDLGEMSRIMAGWMELSQKMKPPAAGFGRG